MEHRESDRRCRVPVGIERVLLAAAVDEALREELLRDRDAAALARGFALTPSEASMLRLAPAEQLRASIAGMNPSPENLERRHFMRAVAATVASVVAVDALSGCGGIRPEDEKRFDSGGIRPDTGPSVGGIRPDTGADGIVTDAPPATRGIQPDLPPIPGPDSAGIRPDTK